MSPRTHASPELVALAHCSIVRPSAFGGAVEIVSAAAAPRGFPLRVSEGLGVCLKLGRAHGVTSDGRRLVYPESSICIRHPGTVWSSDVAAVGFVSIDIAPRLLPGGLVRAAMRFAPAPELPRIDALARALDGPDLLGAETALARLLDALHAHALVAADELSEDGPPRTVERAREFLANRLETPTSLDELALATRANKYVLIRRFRRELGTTPHHYLVRLRIERARACLSDGMSLAEVAAKFCFADQGHFSRAFKSVVGMAPGRYARTARSISIKTRARPAI
jgi:AraC-like DNA-binding protein